MTIVLFAALSGLAIASSPPPPPPEGVVEVPRDEVPEEAEVAEVLPPEPPPTCRPEAVYPGSDWSDAVKANSDDNADAIAAFEAYAFSPELDWADKDRQGVRTDGVVIVKGGQIVYERYANGYGPDSRHLAWSMTKTLTGLYTGMAVGDGLVDPDDSICAHLEGLPESSCAVTVDHLLQFASGFNWLETYEGYSPTQSSVLAMLYGEGTGNMGTFVASHENRDTPGGTYMYSSGDTNVVAHVLDAAFRPQDGASWPHARLFEPLGMERAVIERDGADVIVGSSYWWDTPRDMARLGLFLREDGCWQGERLVPEGWIARMGEVNDAIRQDTYDRAGHDVQGRQLWLNKAVPEQGMDGLAWPHVPEDAMAALGHWKQNIVVIPSLDLVIVRTGDDRDGSFERDRFLALAIAAAGEGEVPPESDFAPTPWPAGPPAPAKDGKYDNSLFQIASGFAAKEGCSCLFVAERNEDFCKEYIRVSPDVARIRIKSEDKVVKARALGMGKQVATWVDDERGCRLER